MPTKLKLSFLLLPLLVITFLLLSKNSPVEAAWTFDGYNPTATITTLSTTADTIIPKLVITDNLTINYNHSSKEYQFLVNNNPVVASPKGSCPIPPNKVRINDLPCVYKVSRTGTPIGANIFPGTNPSPPPPEDLKSVIVQYPLGPFDGNTAYYIFGRINQDDAGNRGQWSNSINFTPSPPPSRPFIQTKEGDVHTNDNINNRP